ncbi:hypothetical protein [Marinobacter salarius]|jgi:hypothetical protein|uniref:hypothetical protein n=1 Tax=Marinobacter salarius TaxID=1420917 RepID=UPI0010AB3B8F|nr:MULTISPECIES: hypothetical protein [Marinobacter]MBJ7302099.1 hypothetical protein [Marinobacter salarius]HIO30781.1 hypothetical protein [Marinobacter salarius]HIP01720.1 hypothetical protein [Marinobacter salarius]
MDKAPETIYLIPGEDIDGVMGYLWCDDPAPSNDHDPAEAVEYVRKDKHQAIIDRQAKAAKMGMDAAKRHGVSAENNAKRYMAASNPEALESERAMNTQLTDELDQSRKIIAELVEFCEQPEIVAATDGAFDPDAIIQRGKRFLSGGENV